MEFSGYYYTNNRYSEYIIFVKQNDLIYIETQINNITITFDELKNNYNLYGYYLLSIALTPKLNNIFYCNEGCFCDFNPDRKWSIETMILNKHMRFKRNNYCGFETDPRKWILSLSPKEEYNDFFRFSNHSYNIITFFIDYEIIEISEELRKQENQINEADFQIKSAATLMSILPFDIALIISNISVPPI